MLKRIITRLPIALLLFFLFPQLGSAASGADSILQRIQAAEPGERLELWENWKFNASADELLFIWNKADVAYAHAVESLGIDKGREWYFKQNGAVLIYLQNAGQGGASTEILDHFKNMADSLAAETDDGIHVLQGEHYYYLGYFNYKQLDTDEAETYFLKSAKIAREVGAVELEQSVYDMMGLMKSYINEYKEALYYYSKAGDLMSAAGVPEEKRLNLNKNIAFLYHNLEDYERSDSLYRTVINAPDYFRTKSVEWRTKMDYAVNLAFLGQAEEALNFLNRMRPEIEADSSETSLLVMAESYADVYFLAGDLKEGAKWLGDSRAYYYKIQENRRKDEVQEWQAKYQNAEQEATINALEQEKTISRSRTIIGTLIALGLIGLLAFFLYANQSRRKRLALQLDNEREIHSSRSKFFASIAHDIRTPLSLMLAPLERLQDNLTDVANKADVQLARRNGIRLLDLFDQILDWNKADAKMLRHNPQAGNVQMALNGLVQRFAQLAAEKGIKIKTKFDLPNGEFLLDYGKLDRILTNLIANAVKYCSKDDEVVLKAELRDLADSSTMVLEVSDNGPGITSADQAHIFTRYYQGDQGKLKGGSGIGLALVQELVGIMHGTIEFKSLAGQGAKFIIKLPITPVAHLVEATATPEGEPDGEVKPSILIVEDEPELAVFIASELSKRFEVFTANTVASGLEMAKQKIPDAIISDWMLPDGDGGEICRRLIEDELTAHIPILVLTAFNTDEHRKEALDSGAIVWMSKPFQLSDLNLQIDTVLQQQLRSRAKWEASLPENVVKNKTVDPFIAKVHRVIMENYDDEDFSMDRMADALTVSRVQLFRKVKNTIGNTPGRLLNEFRLQKARQLLRSSAESVSDACFQVGFSDPGYFAKLYKQRFGLSPSQEVKAA